jgi:hypothetical protein
LRSLTFMGYCSFFLFYLLSHAAPDSTVMADSKRFLPRTKLSTPQDREKSSSRPHCYSWLQPVPLQCPWVGRALVTLTGTFIRQKFLSALHEPER